MSIRVREERYIFISPSGGYRLDGTRRWAGVTVAIDNIDKLGAKPGLLGVGRLTVSVAYVSRERYVCLTGKNLAGWELLTKTLLFLPPALGTIAHQNFAFFAPRPRNGIRISGLAAEYISQNLI